MPQILDVKGAARANSYMLPPEALLPGDNARRVPDQDVEDMIQEILLRGQMKPITIQWNSENQLEIVDGHRRHLAVQRINERKLTTEPLKLRCEPFKGEREDAFAAAVAIQTHQKDLDPMDRAYDIERLEKAGKTRKEIAQILNISEPLISRALKLTKLPKAIQRKVSRGEIASETAYELADMKPEDRDKAMESKPAEPSTQLSGVDTDSALAGAPAIAPDNSQGSGLDTPETFATAEPSAPIKAEKVTRERIRQVKREKAERGEETSGPVGRTKKEIRAQFAEWSAREDETVSDKVKKVCNACVRFMDGEVGPRAVITQLRELEEGE